MHGFSITVNAGGLAPSVGLALPAFMLSGLCASAVGTLFWTLVQTRARRTTSAVASSPCSR